MPQDDLNDRPYLFIPTYPPPLSAGNDTGLDRPVPAGVVFYLCPGINVLSPYQPGSPLSVEVTVTNWGGGNSPYIAFVEVFWSPALSGPTIPDPNKRIGFSSVVVGTHGAQSTSDVITINPMPANAPQHICLLAKVWHALDMPPTTEISPGKFVEIADPYRDRHWAQHNLFAIPAVGGPQKIAFLASNPFPQDALIDLVVQPLADEKWSALERSQHGTPVHVDARFGLFGPGEGADASEVNGLRRQLTLGPGEHREMGLIIDVPQPMQPDTYTAFEILQFQSDQPVGGIAVVLRGDYG